MVPALLVEQLSLPMIALFSHLQIRVLQAPTVPQESGTLKKSLAGEMESAGSEIEPQNHIKSKPSGCDGMQSQPSTEEVGRGRALGLTGQST